MFNGKRFNYLTHSKPCIFVYSSIFNRTHGTSKPGNYIYENNF